MENSADQNNKTQVVYSKIFTIQVFLVNILEKIDKVVKLNL